MTPDLGLSGLMDPELGRLELGEASLMDSELGRLNLGKASLRDVALWLGSRTHHELRRASLMDLARLMDDELRKVGLMDLGLWKAVMAGRISFFNEIKRELDAFPMPVNHEGNSAPPIAARMREAVDVYLRQVNHEGNSALHIAAEMGHFELVVFFCDHYTELIALANKSGDYPMHCAARAGHLQIVVHINTYQRDVSAVNKLGNTALLEAAQNGHALVVGKLLSVDPATAGTTNCKGISPLYVAAERGSADVVELLLDTGMASPGGPEGQNALHAAVVRSLEITKLIVEPMPYLIVQRDITASTPLHYAASHADIKIVRFLLKTFSSAVYMRDTWGFSAIHVAASIGRVNIIDDLLKICPDCMKIKDVKGRNFLHIAIEKERVEVVNYVLQSRVLVKLVNLPDDEGNTALHLAVLARNAYIVELLSMNAEVYISPMNNMGDTPLDCASSIMVKEPSHRMDKIRRDLIANGSRSRPQRLDHLPESPLMDENELMNRYRAIVSSHSTVAVLIATVTFAAVFTMPGGYSSDNGTSLRASDLAFKIFLISDTVAMVSSVVSTFILVNTGSPDADVRLCSLDTAKKLIWVALAGMTIAFGTNVLVVVKRKWMAVLVCVISCSVFLGIWWPAFVKGWLLGGGFSQVIRFCEEVAARLLDFVKLILGRLCNFMVLQTCSADPDFP